MNEIISEGLSKLNSIPAGVGPAQTGGNTAAVKEEVKEEEAEEEEMEEGAMDLFGGDDDW